MPKVPRPGKKGVYLELPQHLFDALEERRKTDRRSRTTTIIMAIEQYLSGETPKKRGKK